MEATSSRATTQFMRQLKRMFEEVDDIIWDHGAIIIPDPAKLEKILPRYYKTSKFSSFQRQLNNFGYHRSYATNERIDRSKSRGVCYHKVAGAPPSVDIEGLLTLRPLVRRKKREAPPSDGEDEPPRRRLALSGTSVVARRPSADAEAASEAMGAPPSLKTGRGLAVDSLADAARCLLAMNDAAACGGTATSMLLPGQSRPAQWI